MHSLRRADILTSESDLIIICIISKNVKDMDIKELKEYVDAKIKENGRQEITGPILNKVLNSAIDTLDDTASAEVTEAVETLQNAIDSEASTRESADKALNGAVVAEASTRESADTAITSRVEKLEAIPIAKGTGVGSVLVNSVDSNQSGGKYSFSVGEYSNASAECSSAIGSYCSAYGKFSFCAGQGCATLGNYGIALGNHTISGYSAGAVALCNYNEDDTDLIHSVGIGSGDSARKNAEAIYTDGKTYVYGVGGYDGTKASIASGAKDVATVASELALQKTTANIDTLTTAQIAPYYHNASTTISGTLPDGVTTADRFRLEVLPLGDSYVEQRMTVPTNGSVAVYTRIWNGSSWGGWV